MITLLRKHDMIDFPEKKNKHKMIAIRIVYTYVTCLVENNRTRLFTKKNSRTRYFFFVKESRTRYFSLKISSNVKEK